jgi:hypothetical protein
MESSTIIERAKISDERETRCNVPSNKFSTTSDPKTVTPMTNACITPLRKPIVSISTPITITMAANRLSMKVFKAVFTLSGWKNILWTSIPAGRRSVFRCSRSMSTSFPILVTSVPLIAEMDIPKARCWS